MTYCPVVERVSQYRDLKVIFRDLLVSGDRLPSWEVLRTTGGPRSGRRPETVPTDTV